MSGGTLMRTLAGFLIAALMAVLLGACQPIQPMTEAGAVAQSATTEPATTEPATTEPATTEPATTESTASGAAAVGAAPMLTLASTEALGNFLADASGLTLYQFDKDVQGMSGAAAVSTCFDDCADAWPPLFVEAGQMPTAGDGLDAALVGTSERKDGTFIATYNGWPLYYWYEDLAPGDTLGQAVGNVWWVLTPDGEPVRGILKLGESDALGEFLADMDGMTLYMFDNDTQGTASAPATSNCNDQCADAWPPFLLEEGAWLLPGMKVDGALLGTTERADGSTQVTYNGWPLYYWKDDAAPGDVLGQAVRDVWWVVGPAGEPVR